MATYDLVKYLAQLLQPLRKSLYIIKNGKKKKEKKAQENDDFS